MRVTGEGLEIAISNYWFINSFYGICAYKLHAIMEEYRNQHLNASFPVKEFKHKF